MTDDERLGPPPIEPLSDAAWSRVERGVWSQLDAASGAPVRATRWRWLAAGTFAAAAVAAIVLGLGLRAGDAPIVASDELSRVVSGAAPSAVSFGNAHVALDAETALVLNRESGHPIVLVERGAAWFTVAPRGTRPDFVVRAGDATVRVVGTRFRVARSDERITVDVEHGVVDVRFRGAVATVSARQHWSSDVPGRASTIASATPAEPDAPVGPVAAAEAVQEEVATPDALPTTRDALPAPAATPRPRATRQATDADDKVTRKATSTATSKATGKITPDVDATLPVADAAASLRATNRAEYDRLAALEPTQPAVALAGYLALARTDGPWADPALFAAARLAVDRGDRRAAGLLGIYLQRFPAGANATDARQLLARLQGDHR